MSNDMPNPPAGMVWQVDEKHGEVKLRLRKADEPVSMGSPFINTNWSPYSSEHMNKTSEYNEMVVKIELNDGAQEVARKIRVAALAIMEHRTVLRVACQQLDILLVHDAI